jgi:4-amino-4-deoxy-L-arabinose transferase-like glycosyltransferase
VFLLGFCAVFALQALLGVAQSSATVDEPSNLVSGYLELARARYWLKPETLPLVKVMAALPLLFLHVRTPLTQGSDVPLFYDRVLYEFNDADTLLLTARAAMLALPLLLGGLVFFWARRLFGRAAAVFALFLLAFEPNLLAHAPLVTTDLAVACFMFLAVYGLFRLVECASPSRALVIALALALAVVTKLSTLSVVLALGLLGLIAGLERIDIPVRIAGRTVAVVRDRRRKLLGLALVLLGCGVVAYGAVWATYRFDYRPAKAEGLTVDWAEIAPEGTRAAQVVTWLTRTRVLPEPFVYNLIQHQYLARLYPAFLLGAVRDGGSFWYYFAVTMLLKTPVALLILIGVGVALHLAGWRQAPVAKAFVLVPAVVYFVFISATGFNIGHRHLLPVLPFLIVATAAVIPWATARGPWAKGAVAALSLWYVAASCSASPNYLSYFNELVGGPVNGARYLADSNVDWGQDLERLKRYMDRQGLERVWLSYFGTANPDYYDLRYDPLPGSVFPGRRPIPPELLVLEKAPRLSGTVAISISNLQGVYLPHIGVDRGYFEAYRNVRPAALIGGSILVYRVD